MKYIISESSSNTVIKKITEMSSEIGFYQTLKKLRLPLSVVDKFIRPKNGEYFNCEELTEIMFYYIFETKDIPSDFEINGMTISNNKSDDGGLYWDTSIVDLNGTTQTSFGYAQPFACNRDQNMVLGLYFDFYSKGNWINPDDNYIEVDMFKMNESLDMDKIKFITVEEAKNWYLTEYPPLVYKFVRRFFKEAEEYSKKNH